MVRGVCLVLVQARRKGDDFRPAVLQVGAVPCIDRCYCEKKTFADLLAIARREGLDLLELSRREGCGTHCGWCVAYLRRGLRTGETHFEELLPREALPDDPPGSV